MLKNADMHVNFGVSVDISDAYHHLRLSAKIEHYFQFKIDGQFYVARGLPFGWAPAPGIFTKLIR